MKQIIEKFLVYTIACIVFIAPVVIFIMLCDYVFDFSLDLFDADYSSWRVLLSLYSLFIMWVTFAEVFPDTWKKIKDFIL